MENFTASSVLSLLKTPDLMLVLDSDDGNFRYECFTYHSGNASASDTGFGRGYRRVDFKNKASTMVPWSEFSLEKQAEILAELTQFCNFRLLMDEGWWLTCSCCGNEMRGRRWQALPSACTAPQCAEKFIGISDLA